MTFADEPPEGVIAEAFDEMRRFHVYDHERDKWMMSGCDFPGDSPCVVEHAYERGELTELKDPAVLVGGSENLTLVWEDGEDGSLEDGVVDLETAEVAARAVIDGLADRLEVERDRIRVVSLKAPNQVQYFVTAKAPDDVTGEEGER